jgi:hypothetical protein
MKMANWTSRAVYHGKRLADERVKLTDGLIGRLGWHEGADITAQAMREFSETLRDAYDKHEATVGADYPPDSERTQRLDHYLAHRHERRPE